MILTKILLFTQIPYSYHSTIYYSLFSGQDHLWSKMRIISVRSWIICGPIWGAAVRDNWRFKIGIICGLCRGLFVDLNMPEGWWSSDTGVKKSRQVSMVTLWVATTGHRHTDQISGDLMMPTITYTYSRQRTGGSWDNKSTNSTSQSKLYVRSQTASKQNT